MSDPFMQWPVLVFIGMMTGFLGTILFCMVTEKPED